MTKATKLMVGMMAWIGKLVSHCEFGICRWIAKHSQSARDADVL